MEDSNFSDIIVFCCIYSCIISWFCSNILTSSQITVFIWDNQDKYKLKVYLAQMLSQKMIFFKHFLLTRTGSQRALVFFFFELRYEISGEPDIKVKITLSRIFKLLAQTYVLYNATLNPIYILMVKKLYYIRRSIPQYRNIKWSNTFCSY